MQPIPSLFVKLSLWTWSSPSGFVACFFDSYECADYFLPLELFSAQMFIFRQRELPECHWVHPTDQIQLHKICSEFSTFLPFFFLLFWISLSCPLSFFLSVSLAIVPYLTFPRHLPNLKGFPFLLMGLFPYQNYTFASLAWFFKNIYFANDDKTSLKNRFHQVKKA